MKLVFIFGPTASGKTALSLDLASRYRGEIINCDSVQVYKHLDIGSAKPNQEELSKVKHHLISHIDYPHKYTAADFRKDALEKIRELEEQGTDLVFVVGGTGFYFRALELGMPELPEVREELKIKIREEAEVDIESLYRELETGDPEYARKIHPKDSYRICRGVELLRSSPGVSISELFKKREREIPWPVLKIALFPSRDSLREKMQKRCENMFSQGWIPEVERVLEAGMENWSALEALGYKEILRCLKEGVDPHSALNEIVTRSMQLAKRQQTWFKNEKADILLKSPVDWGDSEEEIIKSFIQS